MVIISDRNYLFFVQGSFWKITEAESIVSKVSVIGIAIGAGDKGGVLLLAAINEKEVNKLIVNTR